MRVLGLDEAGRGSVLGPLVVGAVGVDSRALDRLVDLGVTDSKRLSRPQREALFPQIEALATVGVVRFDPSQLEENLTQVELRGMARLIELLEPEVVYLDAPVPPAGIPAFVARLRGQLGGRARIVAQNKAELRYPVVAAASIVAKVTRDRAMLRLHARHGDLGWGYPGEPKTRAFLERCARAGEFPPCVRTRWATVQRLKRRSLF